MKVFKNYVLPLVLMVMILSVASTAVQAQGMKIGFIRDDRIRTEFKDWLKAEEDISIELKAWDDEVVAKKAELQELINEYDKQRLILSDDKKKEKEAAIMAKQEAIDAFTRQVWGPNGSAEIRQQNLLEPLLKRVNAAIEKVALDEAYDVIFTSSSGLGYINPTFEVTDKVLDILEKGEE